MSDTRLTLDELANKYVTDKGTNYPRESRHGYAPFYDELLTKWRDEPIRMLEIGVCMEGTVGGHSIYMWNDYFTKANIFTFDIVNMYEHPAITQNERVSFFRGDQGNRDNFEEMFETFGNKNFDFILEDGSHITRHQMISLGHLFKYINSGGIYFLEDISIPGHQVCCITNDETFKILDNFIKTGHFNSTDLTQEEKEYLENNIEKIVLFTDVQDAYMTAAIYKK